MIKRFFLFLLIFSLPFQLGYHFWLPESYVRSFRIDYLAPTLYLTDIIILTFLLLNLPRVLVICKNFFIRPAGWLFLLLILINSYASSANPITLLAWARLGVYFLLLAVLTSTPGFAQKIRLPFTLSLAFTIGLSLIQFLRQSSLGGIFYLFGERPLAIDLPNVAKLSVSSLGISNSSFNLLRPYATFSHPNSLAGYLLVSLVILSLVYKGKKLIKVPLGLAILLTLSKAALLSFVVIEVLEISFIQSLLISLALSVAPLLKDLVNLPVWLAQSIITRHFLLLPTFKIIGSDLLLGVGLKQFIPSLAAILPASQTFYATLQPVHHTFLLIFAELGLFGVLLITKIVWSPLSKLVKDKTTRPYLLDLFGIILMTGSLDHYWWTLPQNQLIIILALALISNSSFPSPVIRRGRASTLAGEVKQ